MLGKEIFHSKILYFGHSIWTWNARKPVQGSKDSNFFFFILTHISMMKNTSFRMSTGHRFNGNDDLNFSSEWHWTLISITYLETIPSWDQTANSVHLYDFVLDQQLSFLENFQDHHHQSYYVGVKWSLQILCHMADESLILVSQQQAEHPASKCSTTGNIAHHLLWYTRNV